MFVPIENRPGGESQIDVLKDAEALLRRDGWIRGNPTGFSQHCVGQALSLAAFKAELYYRDVEGPILRAAAIQTGKEWRSIPHYNDAPERTVDDVWDLFRIARGLA